MGRILVTGAAGFIGSHLSRRLLDDGQEVVGVDCLTDYYDPTLKRRNLQPLLARPGFQLIEADLRTSPLEPIVEGVDGVYHQAAQAGVRASWGESFHDYSTINIEATQRLLEACRITQVKLKRFVYASSSSVYGDAPVFPTAETAATLPISPYGVTKLAGEMLVRLYGLQYGLPTASLRYFTVYGPRQRPDMGFHRFLKAIRQGTEITLYGDGQQTRDFTYVDDAVQANLLAFEQATEPGIVFNIGGGSRTSVTDVLELMGVITGNKVRIQHHPVQAGDVRHTGADASRARSVLGYEPRVTLREGLARMDAWMERYLEGLPE